MTTNKHFNFFSGKTYFGLIKLIVEHRTNENPLGEEWYNALIEHLKKRPIPESVKELIESAINDDLLSLKENIAINKILKKGTDELNIPQIETQHNTKPLANLSLEKTAEKGVDRIKQINKDEIINAGNSIKGIGLLIGGQFLITVGFLLLVMGQKDIEAIKTYYALFALISFGITILIVLQFITAGDALKNSVKNN